MNNKIRIAILAVVLAGVPSTVFSEVLDIPVAAIGEAVVMAVEHKGEGTEIFIKKEVKEEPKAKKAVIPMLAKQDANPVDHVSKQGHKTSHFEKENPSTVDGRIKKQEKKYGLMQVHSYDVRQGGNINIPIALGLLNRFETPFAEADAVTANDAEIFTEEGDVFIATTSLSPLNIIISERGVPESSISLTLLPQANIAPTMAHIHVPFKKHTQDVINVARARLDWEKAEQFRPSSERNSDHIGIIKNILRPLALGETPPGFNLEEDFNPSHNPCNMAVVQKEGQRLIGSRHHISVYLIKNTTDDIFSINEESCYGPGVLAVAAYPSESLYPGEATELYLLRGKKRPQIGSATQKRPSLLGGEQP